MLSPWRNRVGPWKALRSHNSTEVGSVKIALADIGVAVERQNIATVLNLGLLDELGVDGGNIEHLRHLLDLTLD